MRIGILTHHYVKNYGAFLQARALMGVIKEMQPGAEVVFVNFIDRKHLIKNIVHVLHYRMGIDSPASYVQKVRQLFVFSKYEHMLPRTRRVKSAEEIEGLGLDLIVMGSDEIWNILDAGYHPLKFGCGFAKETRLIAYAPSVGSVSEETKADKALSEGLINFFALSARDEQTQHFVKRMTGRDALRVLDPTLLFDFGEDVGAVPSKAPDFPYILIYDCKLNDRQAAALRKYADERGLKVIGGGDYKPYYDKSRICLTPYEWVRLFMGACGVITGTFHGTVFAVKAKKPFVAYPTEENRINKISSLLTDIGLSKRLLPLGGEDSLLALLNTDIDYQAVEEVLRIKRAYSIGYLRDAIGKELGVTLEWDALKEVDK